MVTTILRSRIVVLTGEITETLKKLNEFRKILWVPVMEPEGKSRYLTMSPMYIYILLPMLSFCSHNTKSNMQIIQ